MGVDAELYRSSIERVFGPVGFRDLNDYDHVTDSGILRQVIEENELSSAGELAASVKTLFLSELSRHIEDNGSFPAIDGAVHFIDRLRGLPDTRIAIATGGWRVTALLKLKTSGFAIEGIPLATSDDSPSRVEIMRTALHMTGRDPGVVTYFGDAEWDQRACEELGWNFVAVGPRLGGLDSFSRVQL